jgi:hypothetical protein
MATFIVSFTMLISLLACSTALQCYSGFDGTHSKMENCNPDIVSCTNYTTRSNVLQVSYACAGDSSKYPNGCLPVNADGVIWCYCDTDMCNCDSNTCKMESAGTKILPQHFLLGFSLTIVSFLLIHS